MSSRLRAAVPLAVLALAVLAAAYVTGTAPEGPPLDPRSPAPEGTRALVDSLEALGADVRLGDRPRDDDTAALVLTDTLGEDSREALRRWVRRGGVLVVTDPLSGLAAEVAGTAGVDGFTAPTLDADCDLPAATLAETVRPSPTSAVYRAPAGGTACFPSGDGHWLVAEREGDGLRVALGGPDVLTNARLRDTGHAVVAVGLLAPEPQAARVTVVTPPRPGEGDAALSDLVPRSVWLALAQLAVAFVLLVAWRARRLVLPVGEPQPVDLPASELIAATGDLLADARARGRAAELLREDLRRELAERFGLAASTPPDRLREALMARYGLAGEDVARVLEASDPRGDDDLVTLARAAERLRRAVLEPVETGGGVRDE